MNRYYAGIGGIISEVGIEYSTNISMFSALSETSAIISPFNLELMPLEPNTTYYYHAYVISSSRTYFGEINSFATQQRL